MQTPIDPPPNGQSVAHKETGHWKRFATQTYNGCVEYFPCGKQLEKFIVDGGREMNKAGWSFLIICVMLIAVPSSWYFYHKGYHNGWRDLDNYRGDQMQMQLTSLSQNDREKKYQDWYNIYDGDSPNLCLCGAAAYKFQDWDASIGFFKSAFNKGLWDNNCYQWSPYYIAALIQKNQTDAAVQQMEKALKMIDIDIGKGSGSLREAKNLGGFLTRISAVKETLPENEKHYLDTFRQDIKIRLNDKRVMDAD